MTAVFRRILLSALAGGLAAGLVVAAVQAVTTTPLIHAAERFEAPAHDHSHAAQGRAAPEPDRSGLERPGLERVALTVLTDILAGMGYGFMLAGCFALSGRPVDGRSGTIWGLAGFAVFALAPALGLPPELPGAAASELAARQGWWVATAALTAAGLWLLVFRRGWFAAVGVVLIALPHLYGAPEAAGESTVPAELAARFAASSLVTAAIFWALLGWAAGTFYARLGRGDAASP